MYFPEFGDNRLGVRAGLGVQIPLSDNIFFNLGTDFQHVFLKEDDLSFQHFHAGFDIKLR
jgi:opacity protein-like surface antigen